MLIENKTIAIVGGGPGGLTLASLLRNSGAHVTVYERDINKDVRIQGGSLDLHDESGLAALRKAGLLGAFQANYRPGAEKLRVVDNQAVIRLDEHLFETSQDFGDPRFRPEIDRGPLRDILLASLPPGAVVYDSHVTAMEAAGEAWKLTFQNGKSVTADIVIGADGARSKIRPFVTPIKPTYVGITMIEGALYDAGKAPRVAEILKGGKIFAFSNQKSLFVSSKGDGSLGFGPGWKTDEFWVRDCGFDFQNPVEVLAWFKKEFSEWSETWHELFQEGATFIPRPQYCMPLNQTWDAQANITLVGDAAHWMPPYAGEGVNMAMQDALELSESLQDDRFKNLKSAISAYEKKMRKRAKSVMKDTLDSTKLLHSPQALSAMVKQFGSQQGRK